jgi:hypothetical protein
MRRSPPNRALKLAAGLEKGYLCRIMDDKKLDWDRSWQGLEPAQPRTNRTGLVVGLLAAAFMTLGICALGYFVLQQRAAGAEPGLTPPGPDETEPAVGEEATEEGGAAVAPTVTLPGEFATPELPPPASDVVAPRAAAPLTIDGDPLDWAGLPSYSSPYIVFTDDAWDGSDDLAASWQVSWDDANLYFVANVADDTHAQNQTGNQTFRGDSIELQIDSDRAGDYGPSVSPDDYQIALSPGDFAGIPPSAFRFQGTNDDQMLDAPTPHSIIVFASSSGSGYALEAAIPWRDLGITPTPGLVIGLAVNVNDNDRPGTAAQEMMKSSTPERRFDDPTTWGTLTLQ